MENEASDSAASDTGSIQPSGQKEGSQKYDIAVVKQFFENQAKEIDLKKDELAVRKQELELSHTFALKSLESQDKYISQDTADGSKKLCWKIWFSVFCVAAFVGFIWLLLFYGQGSLVQQVVTHILAVAMGGFGGYGYSQYRRVEKMDSSASDRSEGNQ